jgi:(S)-ureidoglycine aminohydrolase
MHHLGHTRSSFRPDHLLQTPDVFVRAPLPGMTNATAIVHAAPAMGAAFIEYTVEFDAEGSFEIAKDQSFVYVLQGEVRAAVNNKERRLSANQYAYLAPESGARLTADKGVRVIVIEKPFVMLNEKRPGHLAGDAPSIAANPMDGDEAVEVRMLIPADPVFDFAVNTMTFQPGATLPRVEIHEMEHGLLMLEGEGIYRLGDQWYPVRAGDFIWMAPYCPQWFGALGKKPSKYLIYKNWNRHPLQSK